MAKKKEKYVSRAERNLRDRGLVKTDSVGDNLPLSKQEFVIDHQSIRPNGFKEEMPEIKSNDEEPLKMVTIFYEMLDISINYAKEMEKVTGYHSMYSQINDQLRDAYMCTTQLALDVAGNISREDYASGTQPANLNNIIESKVNADDKKAKD